jgi:hypothetical protein
MTETVRTGRKLSEPALAMHTWWLLKAFAARSIIYLMISAGFSGARDSNSALFTMDCGGRNCAGLPRRLSR